MVIKINVSRGTGNCECCGFWDWVSLRVSGEGRSYEEHGDTHLGSGKLMDCQASLLCAMLKGVNRVIGKPLFGAVLRSERTYWDEWSHPGHKELVEEADIVSTVCPANVVVVFVLDVEDDMDEDDCKSSTTVSLRDCRGDVLSEIPVDQDKGLALEDVCSAINEAVPWISLEYPQSMDDGFGEFDY